MNSKRNEQMTNPYFIQIKNQISIKLTIQSGRSQRKETYKTSFQLYTMNIVWLNLRLKFVDTRWKKEIGDSWNLVWILKKSNVVLVASIPILMN